MPPTLSPTVLRMRAALAQRFPEGARPHLVGRQRQQLARRRPDRVRRADQHALRRSIAHASSCRSTATSSRPRPETSARPRRSPRGAAALLARLDEPALRRRTGPDRHGHERRPPAAPAGDRRRALRAAPSPLELSKNGVNLGDDVQRSVVEGRAPTGSPRSGSRPSRRTSRPTTAAPSSSWARASRRACTRSRTR